MSVRLPDPSSDPGRLLWTAPASLAHGARPVTAPRPVLRARFPAHTAREYPADFPDGLTEAQELCRKALEGRKALAGDDEHHWLVAQSSKLNKEIAALTTKSP